MAIGIVAGASLSWAVWLGGAVLHIGSVQAQAPSGSGSSQVLAERPWLERHQTLLGVGASFVIGVLTLANVYFSNRREERRQKNEDEQKKIAFFVLIEHDVMTLKESLQTSKEVLSSIDPDADGAGLWESAVRVAARIHVPNLAGQDWEKLYVIGFRALKALRELKNSLDDLDRAFKSVLEDGEAIRSHALPLFASTKTPVDKSHVAALITSIDDGLTEAINNATKLLNEIQPKLAKIGGGDERHALAPET